VTDYPQQMGFQDMEGVGDEYAAFVEKFKPKKTTDDCYTPENVYEVVASYVERKYGRRREDFVRPFWPGADYERASYPPGCVVVDNPPFSILRRIVDFYLAREIDFFLFAPGLTAIGYLRTRRDMERLCVIADAEITYENGATVRTAFLTTLEKEACAVAYPELTKQIARACTDNKKTKQTDKYTYPPEVLTSAGLQYYAVNGVRFEVPKDCAMFMRELDAQRQTGKAIFGSGLLLSARAAAKNEAARAEAEKRIVWELSPRERKMVQMLDEERSKK